MDKEIFEHIQNIKATVNRGERIWTEDLASEQGYSSPEALRSAFRRYKRKISVNQSEELPKTSAKILLFDVETSPILTLVWSLWDNFISTDAIVEDWHLVSWSARWLFDDTLLSDVLTPNEALAHDDKRIAKSIWKLLDEADIVVAHNGDKFDIKKLNTRFLFHGFPPPMHYRSVDTLKVAKNYFKFTSNKLDYINKFLGIPVKSDHDFDLWKRAYFGDPTALKDLVEYNKNDVFILEETFLKVRPYIKTFPNLNLYDEGVSSICRNCGSPDIYWSGYYYTNLNKYKGWRCNNCGAIGRSRYSSVTKEKRLTIVA